MVLRELRLLFVAAQFLTRLPIRSIPGFVPADLTRAARWFPLVGQFVGAVCAVSLLLADHLWGSGWTPALVALAVGVLITGAFHEDGLADTADGLGGGQTPERRLEIMRDSRVGTYGVLALGLTLALKASALAALSPAAAALALVAAHGLGRATAVMAMRLTPYADAGNGKWKPTPRGVSTGEAMFAAAVAAWPLIWLGAGGVIGLVAGLALAAMLLALALRLIGGHTGDVLGGIEEVFEAGFLLGLSAVLA